MLSLFCAACGFQPMYGSYSEAKANGRAGIQAQLARIEVANIKDREGQILRNALIDRFYQEGRPVDARYTLQVSDIAEATDDLDITITSDATRAQLKLSTVMTLVDNETNAVVLERGLKAVASYNIMNSEFATRVSEKNVRENALKDLARQIERHLALYFNNNDSL
ncbi:MAG: LPS assembly lipoprotein LptE [Alphaproteobacteria bacterium]